MVIGVADGSVKPKPRPMPQANPQVKVLAREQPYSEVYSERNKLLEELERMRAQNARLIKLNNEYQVSFIENKL